MTDLPLLRARMRASPDTPHLARKVVACTTDEIPAVRAFDVALLTSELVTARIEISESVDVTIDERARALRVEVTSRPPGAGKHDELVEGLLDRLASRWDVEGDSVWFEIETIRRRAMGALDEADLFSMLPDHDARSEIYDRFVGFATSLARRFTRAPVAQDDLEQVAGMALVKAIDRFDPDHGAAFTTYAAATIKGELKRHLRDTSWSMRVPRRLKDASLRVRRAESELTQTLGRPPTMEELAAETDLDVGAVHEAQRASSVYSAESIDAPLGEDGDGISLASILGSEDEALQRAEAWQAVERAMSHLDERERRILYLRFFEDMSQSEIAAEVGVSQMHVSRLLARSIEDIRRLVGESATPDHV